MQALKTRKPDHIIKYRKGNIMNLRIIALLASLISVEAIAADKIVIISPHRKSIQEEYIPVFKQYYKDQFKTDVQVDWIDQGGTSNDIRFIRSKFSVNPKTSEVDLFWGGGTVAFLELQSDKLLDKFEPSAALKKNLPAEAAGVAMYDKSKTWYASAMSSFGIFYNKKLLAIEKLPEPKTWEDLADPKYLNKLSLADPRHSGSAGSMNTIILQSLGWEKGWEILTAQGGNNRQWAHSSSDPIKAVVAGDAAVAPAIDFYAMAKIGDIGKENLGFAIPVGKSVLDPDPVAILKGAPNRKVAERFVEWVLGTDAQAILVLPKGAAGGPRMESLARMAVITDTDVKTEGKRIEGIINPFAQKSFLKLDNEKAAKLKRPLDDLIGALLIDNHKDLKTAWQRVIKNGAKPADLAALSKMPVTEAELLALAEKWDDNVLRNETINKWVNFAREKYLKVGGSTH